MTIYSHKLDKDKVIDLIRLETAFAQRTFAQLTPQEMLIPNAQGAWSVKDLIAHLNAWMRRVLGYMAVAQAGGQPAIPAEGYTWEQIDLLNDTTTEAERGLPLPDVLTDFERLTGEVLALVERLPDEDIFAHNFNGAFRDPYIGYLAGNTYEHFQEHIIPLRGWIAALKTRQSLEGDSDL